MNKIDEIANRASAKIREAMIELTDALNAEIAQSRFPPRHLEVSITTDMLDITHAGVDQVVCNDAGVSITVQY